MPLETTEASCSRSRASSSSSSSTSVTKEEEVDDFAVVEALDDEEEEEEQGCSCLMGTALFDSLNAGDGGGTAQVNGGRGAVALGSTRASSTSSFSSSLLLGTSLAAIILLENDSAFVFFITFFVFLVGGCGVVDTTPQQHRQDIALLSAEPCTRRTKGASCAPITSRCPPHKHHHFDTNLSTLSDKLLIGVTHT